MYAETLCNACRDDVVMEPRPPSCDVGAGCEPIVMGCLEPRPPSYDMLARAMEVQSSGLLFLILAGRWRMHNMSEFA